jgi:hypothetical protein
MKQQVMKTAFAAILAAGLLGAAPALAQTPTPQQLPDNDPFYKPPTKKTETKAAKTPEKWIEVPAPSLDQRAQEYQMRRQDARQRRQPEPNPVWQYLVSELRIMGIYEVDGRMGVFVEAGPQKQTFFLTEGTPIYNGQLVRVVQSDYPSPGRAVFRQETRYTLKKQTKTDVQEITKTVDQPGS